MQRPQRRRRPQRNDPAYTFFALCALCSLCELCSCMADTLFQKVWNAHAVRTLPSGQTQLFVGLHLVHEVTTPQAFDMLRQHGWGVPFPERTFATIDHIVPTTP